MGATKLPSLLANKGRVSFRRWPLEEMGEAPTGLEEEGGISAPPIGSGRAATAIARLPMGPEAATALRSGFVNPLRKHAVIVFAVETSAALRLYSFVQSKLSDASAAGKDPALKVWV